VPLFTSGGLGLVSSGLGLVSLGLVLVLKIWSCLHHWCCQTERMTNSKTCR